jgi:hypothetical protein
MRAREGETVLFAAVYGVAFKNLTTIRYRIIDADGVTVVAATSDGVFQTVADSGVYAVKKELLSPIGENFAGIIVWDVAGGAPFAGEDIKVVPRTTPGC